MTMADFAISSVPSSKHAWADDDDDFDLDSWKEQFGNAFGPAPDSTASSAVQAENSTVKPSSISWSDDDEDDDIDFESWKQQCGNLAAPCVGDFDLPEAPEAPEPPCESVCEVEDDFADSDDPFIDFMEARQLSSNRAKYYTPDPRDWGCWPRLPADYAMYTIDGKPKVPAYAELSERASKRVDYAATWHFLKPEYRWGSGAAVRSVYRSSPLRVCEVAELAQDKAPLSHKEEDEFYKAEVSEDSADDDEKSLGAWTDDEVFSQSSANTIHSPILEACDKNIKDLICDNESIADEPVRSVDPFYILDTMNSPTTTTIPKGKASDIEAKPVSTRDSSLPLLHDVTSSLSSSWCTPSWKFAGALAAGALIVGFLAQRRR